MNTLTSRIRSITGADQAHLLHIYLKDHEAASAGGVQLVQRCWKANQGTRYAADLHRLATDIRADREALQRICRALDVKYSKAGRALAVAGVTMGRLKTNGRAFQYSPLSRVIELEALTAGVKSKLRLWESLVLLAKVEPKIDQAEQQQHVTDANEQLEVIRRLHDMAAEEAFIGSDSP